MSRFIKDHFYSPIKTKEYSEEYINECTRLSKIYLKFDSENFKYTNNLNCNRVCDFLNAYCDYNPMNYTNHNSLDNLSDNSTVSQHILDNQKYDEIMKISDMYYKMDEFLDMMNQELDSRINDESLTYRFKEKFKKALMVCKEFCYLPKIRLHSYEYKGDLYYYSHYDSEEYRYPLKKAFEKLLYKINNTAF